MKKVRYLPLAAPFCLGVVAALRPELAHASVEGSLEAIQLKLVNQILPLVGVLGLVFAAFSFFSGNPNARSHLWLAVIGAAIGFGAESIISLVRGLVH